MNRKFLIAAIVLSLSIICCLVVVIGLFVFIPANRIVGNGSITTEQRDVKDEFKKVKVTGNFEVVLTESQTPSVIINGDENLQKLIRVDVSFDELSIDYTPTFGLFSPNIVPTKAPRITISYKALEQIVLNGNTKLSTDNRVRADKLYFEVNGQSEGKLNVFVKELTSRFNGDSKMEMLGATDKLWVYSNGAAIIDASTLESRESYVEVNGASKLDVRAETVLDIKLTGTGNVTYSGNPPTLKQNISGTGSVTKR